MWWPSFFKSVHCGYPKASLAFSSFLLGSFVFAHHGLEILFEEPLLLRRALLRLPQLLFYRYFSVECLHHVPSNSGLLYFVTSWWGAIQLRLLLLGRGPLMTSSLEGSCSYLFFAGELLPSLSPIGREPFNCVCFCLEEDL